MVKDQNKNNLKKLPPMLPSVIVALIDPIMQEKCWIDLEKDLGPLD